MTRATTAVAAILAFAAFLAFPAEGRAGILDDLSKSVGRDGSSIEQSLKDVGKTIDRGAVDTGKEIDRKGLPEIEQSPPDPCSINNKLPQCLGVEPKQ
jgi:hypothetical protein